MQWRKTLRDHTNDQHAFLSPSNYHWLNYSVDKLREVYRISRLARFRGTKLHDLAAELIDCRVTLPQKHKTLNMYVNDGIKYRMNTEVHLSYSKYCYGTADALSNHDILRIHDLKTGKIPASFKQLEVYVALYLLEQDIKPGDIESEIRIYQNDERIITSPRPEDILPIMDKIILFCDILSEMDEEEEEYELL